MNEQDLQNLGDQKLSRKERRFLKRAEKQGELSRNQRNRLIWKIVKLVFLLVLVGLLVFVFTRSRVNDQTSKPGQFFPSQSREHIAVGSAHPDYSSNPPTSGWHYDQPAKTGIYDRELPDEQLVHNLEHSHVWISYKPGAVDQATIGNLKKLIERFGSKMIMTPRAKNDSSITVATWQYLLRLDSFQEQTITDFIKAHRGKAGPENVP